MKKMTVYTDGGARGNPGPAAAAAIIIAGKKRLICGKYLGRNTNNFAEYTAVLLALEKVLETNPLAKDLEIEIFADSLLAVKQLNREYRVKNLEIAKLFEQIKNLEQKFSKVSYFHIPRAMNKEADFEVNQILDRNSQTPYKDNF